MKAAMLALFLLATGSRGFAMAPHSWEGLDLGSGNQVSVDPRAQPKATIAVFLSAKCPCSASHEVTLRALAAEFPEMKFVGVHSNTDEPENLARDHFRRSALPFPVLQDHKSRLAIELGALKTPHVFVFSPQGKMLFNGGIDNSHLAADATKHYLREALLAIHSGKEPEEKEVRTLGCVIRRDDSAR